MNDPVAPAPRKLGTSHEALAPRESGPPGSFSRLFLERLSKYDSRWPGRDVGTPTEEAAASFAQRSAPARAVHGVDLRSPRAVGETIAITLALPALGFALDHGDPLLLHGRFSWLVFAPMLVALRHGLTLGCASAAALDLVLILGWRAQAFGLERFPSAPFVGLIAVAMVVGQFSDVWKREIVRLDAGFGVLQSRNKELSRSHFLLELSHDRLGEQVGRNANSLRDAIAAVRELADGHDAPSYEALGDAMLEVMGAYCMLELGELHLVDDGALGKAVAALGRPQAVDAKSPLVAEAIRTGRLTHVPAAARSARGHELVKSSLLAVVPFADTAGKVGAVLLVHAMPFISFEKRNLEAMTTLAGHFADLVSSAGESTGAHRGRMDAFEVAIRRAVRELSERKVPSVVAFLWIRRGAAMTELVDSLLGDALHDVEEPYVARDPSGNSFVYILLHAAGEQDARDLRERLEAAARSTRGASLADLGARFSSHVLEPSDSLLRIFRLFASEAGTATDVGRHERVRRT